MLYEKPRPSAGAVVAGLLAFVAANLAGWTAVAMHQPAVGAIGVLLAAIGFVLLLGGLWRFFSAFDAAALHRWQTVVAAKNEEAEQLRIEREHRTEDDPAS